MIWIMPENYKLIETFPEHDIKLYYNSETNWFKVVYFKHVIECPTYSEACNELGTCLLHALTCEGKLI